MDEESSDWLSRVVSEPRFARYRRAANGEVDVAVRLYQWNIDISAAFYGPLHWLEVGLRNAVNENLRSRFGRPDWWEAAPLDKHERRKIDSAADKVARRAVEWGADDVVAELTFGFWVALLHRRNDRKFWVPGLHAAFPHYSGPRSDLHDDLYRMRNFRNRIMHHEPIFDFDLVAYRDGIHRLLGYFVPVVAERLRETDGISEVLMRWGGAGRTDHAGRS